MKTLLLIVCLLLSVSAQAAQTITFAWDASTDAGCTYTLKRGGATGIYTNVVNVGTNLTATVTNLAVGDYYFVVTATLLGLESVPSNEVNQKVPPSPPRTFRVTQALQSAQTPAGPWKEIETFVTIVDEKPEAEFFRVISVISPPMPPMPPMP